MQHKPFLSAVVALVILLALVLLLLPGETSAAGNSRATPDKTGNVGKDSSLELDEFGFPVISYFDDTLLDLKMLHCSNPTCRGAKVLPPPTAGP